MEDDYTERLYRPQPEHQIGTTLQPKYRGLQDEQPSETTEVTYLADLMETRPRRALDVQFEALSEKAYGKPPRKQPRRHLYTPDEWKLLFGVVLAAAVGCGIPLGIWVWLNWPL